jgi:hypothetical protein
VIESERELPKDTIKEAMDALKEVALRMSRETGVPSPLAKEIEPGSSSGRAR